METNELTDDLIHRLSSGDLENIMSTEIFQQNNLYIDNEEDIEHEPDDIIIEHMDIREPLTKLQKLVGQKIGVNLKGFTFWLQDAQELEPHKNLVDQCVKGEGLVQINVQIQTTNRKINIVDVLKPTEAALAALNVTENQSKSDFFGLCENDDDIFEADASNDSTQEAKPALNWVLDNKFKKEQARLKIPEDPDDWTAPQVGHWLDWAIKEFDLQDIRRSDWAITGKELCDLTHEEFRRKVLRDPGNIFWTHLQLLKECKFVSVVHKVAEEELKKPKQENKIAVYHNNNKNSNNNNVHKELRIIRRPTSIRNLPAENNIYVPNNSNGTGSSANNHQVQLWQFLLETLTDREHRNIIQWVGTDGEFKLTDPDAVARLWGEKKNKPAMNYEKLSRALRYYYDGDMISKVSGKRFAYKFDCDLKLLIGYDACELAALVKDTSNQCMVDASLTNKEFE